MSRSISLVTLCLASLLCLTLAGYNPADSKEFASASALAYCQSDLIESWKCGPPCKNLTGYHYHFTELFNVTDDQTLSFSMIYNPSKKRFVNSFRGTQGKVELLMEAMEGGPTDYPGISNALVDDYFYKHYVTVLRPVFYPQLEKAIQQYPDYEFVFTGHSLGAALTVLAALDAVNTGLLTKDQITIYNYGMPRLGDIGLAQAIESTLPQIYRVVHWQDVVPHLPPCMKDSNGNCVPDASDADTSLGGLEWPAWHVTQQIFYNEANTEYTICNGAEDPNCADQFSMLETTINDHHYYMGIGLFCHDVTADSEGTPVHHWYDFWSWA